MVLIETLNHFILTHKQTTRKLQENYKQPQKHDIYGNHEQANTNSTKQQ